jgi:hypothetical protein
MCNPKHRKKLQTKQPEALIEMIGYEGVADSLAYSAVSSTKLCLQPVQQPKETTPPIAASDVDDSNVVYLGSKRCMVDSSIRATFTSYDRSHLKSQTIRKWHSSLYKESTNNHKTYKFSLANVSKASKNLH